MRSIVRAGSLAMAVLLLGHTAQADVDVTGTWAGSGKCSVLDEDAGLAPAKLKKHPIQVTFYEGASAVSGSMQRFEGLLESVIVSQFHFYGFVFAASVPDTGKDSLVAYATRSSDQGCAFLGDQYTFHATVKRDRMKLRMITSPSSALFGSCAFKLRRTAAPTQPSPCP